MRRWNNNDDFLACEPSLVGNISREKLQEGKNNGFINHLTKATGIGQATVEMHLNPMSSSLLPT